MTTVTLKLKPLRIPNYIMLDDAHINLIGEHSELKLPVETLSIVEAESLLKEFNENFINRIKDK